MRKSLLMGGAALVAFALVFGACDGSGYDVTATENIPSLSGPGNLKAVNDQEGVITLTWDPVYDAAGYEVWRKTGEEPAVKLTKSSNKLFPTEVNRFDDIISNTNVLKVNTAYTYTVVAVSSTSTKVPRGI
ncbi:MAG: fibronectin type III domain-containing protein, partial [Treponema sp.]|nr:fibronectin type III domain-containing protein [Treponema sp.]